MASLEDLRLAQVRFLFAEVQAGHRFCQATPLLLTTKLRLQSLQYARDCHDSVEHLVGLIELKPEERSELVHQLAALQAEIEQLARGLDETE